MTKLALVTAALGLSCSRAVVAQDASGPALWQVADEDTNIYLFGTIDILPKDVEWLTDPIKTAFDAASEFVTEIDMTRLQSFAPEIIAAASLPAGETLRSLMIDEDRTEYEEAISILGLPIADLDRLEPWLVAQSLRGVILMRNGYDPSLSVTKVLSDMAAEKQQSALETPEWQLEMLDTTPMKQQLGNLDNIVGWAPIVRQWNERMVDLWVAGDIPHLADHVGTAFPDPAYRARLLTNRNVNWAQWIDDRLDEPGTVFVAVSIGHLIGTGTVQEQLSVRGIEAVRVQ